LAGLDIQNKKAIIQLLALMKDVPEVQTRFMYGIGQRAAGEFRDLLLSGKPLKFKNVMKIGRSQLFARKDKRRMISIWLIGTPFTRKVRGFRLSSSPLNLFEFGRHTKTGTAFRNNPKYSGILTKKFKAQMEPKLGAWANEYAKVIFRLGGEK
jgi:hypothetical protein